MNCTRCQYLIVRGQKYYWTKRGPHHEECPEPGQGFPGSLRVKKQPRPIGKGRMIWPLVIQDMRERDTAGRRKHGVPLRAHNGRDALVDAYQEILDAAVYLRQAIYERDGR